MIVTTAGRTDEKHIMLAKKIALKYNYHYISRNKDSIDKLHRTYKMDVLVVGKERLEWFPVGQEEPIFFHPNTSAFRIKRILRGESEPFLEAISLEKGMSFLDCTLGLASDCVLASFTVGDNGKVIGIEGNNKLAYIVSEGLLSWNSGPNELIQAMKRIKVVATDHLKFLKEQPENSFDVVYFDPMFNETIEESDGIKPLKSIALHKEIKAETILEAKRVAKRRVVLKDHWKSSTFQQFNFQVQVRKTAKFHFGVLEK